jgi:RNA polymerase sigma-70 factor (ECF subfamily)
VFVQSLVSRELPADEVLQDARRLGRVLAEIDRLPRMERAALLLSAVEELENAEMAAVLGKSESAVRALLFRARTRLRERLAKRGGR